MGPGFESLKVHQIVSVISVKGPPVPIPNTEVKLDSAYNTWLETAWEDWSMLTPFERTVYSSLAQSVEHMTVNHGVVGSSPTGGAICTFSSVGRATDS